MVDNSRDIIMYSTTWCAGCRRTKRFLDELGVPYVWIDIGEDAEAAREGTRINGGMRSVPTLVFADGSVLVEPSNKELAKKLGLV